MPTIEIEVGAVGIRFDGNLLIVSLSDGRELSLPLDTIDWLAWLARATPQQRANWALEPNGFAVFWPDLDDGIEVRHLLTIQPLT